MRIVSLILKILPEHADGVAATVATVAGASVQAYTDGKMIVLIEDDVPGAGEYAVSDSIINVHHIANVMSVTLAYEYSDEGLMAEEAYA